MRLATLGLMVVAAAGAQPRPEHGLRFHTPVLTWDEAIPLGNGLMGALVWGDGRPVRISLDRADLWDLRPVEEFYSAEYTLANVVKLHRAGQHKELIRLLEDPYRRPAPTKIPAGRIEIEFEPEAAVEETSLDVAAALGGMRLRGGGTIEVFQHATEPVGMARLRGSGDARVRLAPPPFSGRVEAKAAGGIGAGDLAQLGYPAPRVTEGATWRLYEQEGYGGFRFAIFVEWRDAPEGRVLVWSIATGRGAAEEARRRVRQALETGFAGMLATHKAWWERFWRRSSVRLPNPVIERQWYLDTYKWGAATRRGAPPITLQAVWTADDGKLPPWKGDYHHDLNTQLSYWPAYAGNRLEDGLAYLDWLWKTREAGFAWTRRFFQMPGLNVPMTADLNGNQIGGWRQYTHSATTAAWLAHHFYLHWRYSQDRRFLRERAYPYLAAAAEFLEAYTRERGPDGRRTHPLSSSPEIHDNKPEAWFDTVTNYDLALERWLFGAAAELADELERKAEAERWRRALGELAPLALGEDGRLLVAAGHPLTQSHRHFSHLMAIHPLGLLDMDDSAQARRTIRASLEDLVRLGTDWWTGYSFAWLGSVAARARDGERAAWALETFATAFCLRNSFHVNGDQSGRGLSRFRYRPFTLEGNFAAAQAVHEMLVQSHRGVIRVFPAVPERWRDVSFATLRAEGAFLVSAERRGGKVTRVEVTAEKGGRVRVASPWKAEELTAELRPGERRVWTE